MNVFIKTIDHRNQRMGQCGDWIYDRDGTLLVFVSKMNDWRYEFLIGAHELCEAFLCKHSGIGQKQVDRFDKSYKGTGEPGDAPKSPYKVQHCIATGIERILAAFMGVSWSEYSDAVDKL